METREAYRGTQSDFHTHAHDLPPQMGGCYPSGTEEQLRCAALIDCGAGAGILESSRGEGAEAKAGAKEALRRTLKHHGNLLRANPAPGGAAAADEGAYKNTCFCFL